MRDVLWALVSSQLYELLVLKRGRPHADYVDLVGGTLKAALLA